MITHDLGIVADVADEVAVMYGGRDRGAGPTASMYDQPEMPYTLGCWPRSRAWTGARRIGWIPIQGNPPSPIDLPKGCVFQPRCKYSELR